jgi:ATP/maltotriose-dependent transcriptional regulator MalT
MQLGRVMLERGDLRQSERLMTHAQQDAAAMGQWESAREAGIHLARCHVRRGDPAVALETLRAAQRMARGETAIYDVQAAEVETRILVELGLLDDARGVNDAAVAEARRQGLVFELALLLLAGAEIDARAGVERDDVAFDEAVTILRELGCEARLTAQLAVTAG